MHTFSKTFLGAIFASISILSFAMQPQPNGEPERKKMAADQQNGMGGSEYSEERADRGNEYMNEVVALAHIQAAQQNPVTARKLQAAVNGTNVAEKVPFPQCDDEPLDPLLASNVLANNEEINTIAKRLTLKPDHSGYPRKLLIVGPSGTGKTTLAKAIASAANIPPHLYTISDVGNHWQKSANLNINRIFDRHSNEQCVLIFDELQELINKSENHNDPESSALSTLWTRLDNLKGGKIFFVGVLNYTKKTPEQIKTRFRLNIVEVPLPNFEQRERIITFYMQTLSNEYSFDKEVSAKILADKTNGFCCRSVTDLMIKASILALDESIKLKKSLTDKPIVTLKHFTRTTKDLAAGDAKLEPKESYRAWISRIMLDSAPRIIEGVLLKLIDKGIDSASNEIYNKRHGIDLVKDYKSRKEKEDDTFAVDIAMREAQIVSIENTRILSIPECNKAREEIEKIKKKYKLS